jgi:stearoyl-CoA desaturase (delta-9 desaturase)
VSFLVMIHLTGIGTAMGLHRLFTHRSFETYRLIECGLLILGAMTGQSSPFFWVATHRHHHRFSDRTGDPHSPHAGDGVHASWWRRFWHSHQGWTTSWATYDPNTVRDLKRRPDLAWIDRTWYAWYLLGLALPAGAGYLLGGTGYDALMGLLWGGLLRHAVNQHASYAVNSLGHLWGSKAHDTGDESRNNMLLGVLALGEGWHNNHHAFPYSARHGFHWWQVDFVWSLVWLMERVGLAWKVKRPKLGAATHEQPADAIPPLLAVPIPTAVAP